MDMSLLRLKDGEWCVVTKMPHGEAALRLEALGLRVGKRIQKLSGMPFHGPVTVCVDGRQVAIGHGVAGRIAVCPDRREVSGAPCL
ncbi:Fe2+ transport system protein A [Thermanaerovibrio velox DSM 12556]|uniref:Fe2+ transport system protein A n=1 Tax=Thermanaerovibrio velox DSM 12556 TaxID=926567 RepID=H0UNB5_9BACT|nr:FeoA family protein [Thermanaerovibrio velox]EHM10400.1 Fe2+ transport system protein A [Thermanaerovibrio velox DSM 12556]